jgi:hypothetical protein
MLYLSSIDVVFLSSKMLMFYIVQTTNSTFVGKVNEIYKNCSYITRSRLLFALVTTHRIVGHYHWFHMTCHLTHHSQNVRHLS